MKSVVDRDHDNIAPSPAVERFEDNLARNKSTTQKPFIPLRSSRTHSSPLPSPSLLTTPSETPNHKRPHLNSLASELDGNWGESSESDLRNSSGGSENKGVSRRKGGSGGCKIVIWRAGDGWCGRGNTVSGWVEMNRAALKLLPPAPASSSSSPLPPGVFISPDSLVPTSVYFNLGEKVGIKRCIIGKGCVIGRGSKLTGVIAMEGVVIGEGCVR
jgi:translation initiation factor eIF-2B subunit gamma